MWNDVSVLVLYKENVCFQFRSEQGDNGAAYHLSSSTESGLGDAKHSQVCEAMLDLADPSPTKKRRAHSKYTHYSPAECAQIGRYALENGNEIARKHFTYTLKESTVRNQLAYKESLKRQQEVAGVPHKRRRCPLILLELDVKLMQFFRAVQNGGGIVNIHVVSASAKALIDSNPLMASHLQNFICLIAA